MSRVERDPERGRAVAAELKALGVKKRELIRAAEQGYITELACKMPECFCPEELGGASYFAQVTNDWSDSQSRRSSPPKELAPRALGSTSGPNRDPTKLCSVDGCNAYRMRDGSGLCVRHHHTDEEWREKAVRGGHSRARKAREEDDLFERWRHPSFQPEVLERAGEVILELLNVKVPHLGEPDYEARAWGLELGLRFFARPSVATEALRPARARLLQLYREGKLDLRGLPPELFDLEDDPKDENAEGSSGAKIASELHAGRVS
jgi:hypothetical protein